MLHMYLISARVRCFQPEICKTWQQHFVDHFFTDAENRMVVYHGIDSRGARNGYLKDLFLQWRGVLLAYDEGVVRGDAVLAAAVWRNLFNSDEAVDFKRLVEVVAFMRSSLQKLEGMGDVELVAGRWGFGKPTDQIALVEKRSALLDLPLDQAPGKPVGPGKKA
jgi:cytochrome b pre-mRNA-processing protein 3